MYLVPEGDELEIANAAAEFLADAMTIDRLHGPSPADMSPELRLQLGDMGWSALALPLACDLRIGLLVNVVPNKSNIFEINNVFERP